MKPTEGIELRSKRNEYMRAYRARKRREAGIEPRTRGACGTIGGYQSHVRRKEPTCAACRSAWSAYHKERRRSATA